MEISLMKARSRMLPGLALASSLAGAAWAGTLTTGPLSPYYLDDGNSTIYVVQGTSVVASFPMAYGKGVAEGALAVANGTVRTRGSDLRFNPGLINLAGVYTLTGNPTGYDYATPYSGSGRYYDGTSDGYYNYFVDHGADVATNGGVYRTDLDWRDPKRVFYPSSTCGNPPPGCWGLAGIAYDPINHSLWVSSRPTGEIGEYSLTGALMATFIGAGGIPALGVDPADHTLWATNGSNTLFQYSLDQATLGVLLQSGIPDGLPSGTYESGDFGVITPEPATFAMLLCVVAVSLLWQALVTLGLCSNRSNGRNAGFWRWRSPRSGRRKRTDGPDADGGMAVRVVPAGPRQRHARLLPDR